MALDLGAIRQALADRVNTVAGLRAYAELPEQVATSSGGVTAVMVAPGAGDDYVSYFVSFGSSSDPAKGNLCEVAMRLIVAVPYIDTRAAQERLDAVLSAGTGQSLSLIDALLEDQTLAGTVATLIPRAARPPYQLIVGENDATRYLAADVEVALWTRRG